MIEVTNLNLHPAYRNLKETYTIWTWHANVEFSKVSGNLLFLNKAMCQLLNYIFYIDIYKYIILVTNAFSIHILYNYILHIIMDSHVPT